jgi:hypothetical protein
MNRCVGVNEKQGPDGFNPATRLLETDYYQYIIEALPVPQQ